MFRYDASEVEGPAPKLSDSPAIDEVDYPVEKWKEVIWEEVKLWETIDTSVTNPIAAALDNNENALASAQAAEGDAGKVGGKRS